MSKRRTYSREFKLEALRRWLGETPATAMVEDLARGPLSEAREVGENGG